MKSEVIEKLDKMVEHELHKIVEKGDITPSEIDNATKAVKLLNEIKELCEEDEGHSQVYGRRMYPRNSYERGRSPMTGRYVSRDSNGSYMGPNGNSNMYNIRGVGNYSRHGSDEMIDSLEMMRDQASTEQERRMIDQWIDNAMTV